MCSCGRYLAVCSFCGREPCGPALEPTRLERLAADAGVDAWWLRSHLRLRVSGERCRRLFGSPRPPVELRDRRNFGLAVHAWEAAGGDPLGALELAITVDRKSGARQLRASQRAA